LENEISLILQAQLDKGEQVALGRHEELLVSSAVYREIHHSQHSQGEEGKHEA